MLSVHDGQNVFAPATSYGGVDWGVEETMRALIAARRVRPAIPASSDAYLRFLVEESKPSVERSYRYFDYGTAPPDSSYARYQPQVDDALRAAGHVAGDDWLTRDVPGAERSERAWRVRVAEPLVFLLGAR